MVLGDATLWLRLLLRRDGAAGLVAKLGGLLALVAAVVPWHRVVAEVRMLGEASRGAVAGLSAVPGSVLGWVMAAAGAVAVWLGWGVAFDRPHRLARPLLLVAAVTVAAAAAASWWLVPDAAAAAGAEAARLAEVADRLPTGVQLHLDVHAGPGLWLALAGAAAIAAGAALARE